MGLGNCICPMAPTIMELLVTVMHKARDDSFSREEPFTKVRSGIMLLKGKES